MKSNEKKRTVAKINEIKGNRCKSMKSNEKFRKATEINEKTGKSSRTIETR